MGGIEETFPYLTNRQKAAILDRLKASICHFLMNLNYPQRQWFFNAVLSD